MTRTTKSERKWGKKDTDEKPNRPKQSKATKKVEVVEMYKILIEGCAFSKPMSYEDCQKLINKYEKEADRLKQPRPSLVLVKQ